ncbi:MAG: hypothetical protein ACOYJ1_05945 [Peptococcales bacterium]|jgi:hypothetical protein
MIHLKRGTEEFWPSRHGYKDVNYSLILDEQELRKICEAAYISSFMPWKIIYATLKKTLASGVCSGISAYTLINFYDNKLPSPDAKFWIAVFQARTWGGPFFRQALASYFLSTEKALKIILRGIGVNVFAKLPLLVILPRLIYCKNITQAHTVIPYRQREGLENIYLHVYDSNFPSDDTKVLVYNKTSGFWRYEDKDSKEWVLTVNSLENLTCKVPFLL